MVIRTVFEDKKGRIWVGTFDGGISCFDGKQFINFNKENGFSSNQIISGIQDRKGRYWFGTYGAGLNCFVPELGGECAKGACSHQQSDSLQWSVHNKTISRAIFIIKFTKGINSNIIWSLCEDTEGRIWCGTNGEGAFCFDGKKAGEERCPIMNLNTTNGLTNNVVRCITQDGGGTIWFGTEEGAGSLEIPEKNNDCYFLKCGHNLENQEDFKNHCSYFYRNTYKHTTSNGLAANSIRSIIEDNYGNIWLGTSGNGVSCLMAKPRAMGKENYINYNVSNGLANNVIWSMTKDKEGNIWLGTDGGGLSRYDGPSFVNYTNYAEAPLNNGRSIIEDNEGNIWLTTFGSGVYRFKHSGETNLLSNFTNFTKKTGLSSDLVVNCFLDSKGNIWFGTFGNGISRYDGKTFIHYTTEQGLPNNIVWSIKEDKKGNLWLATAGGVCSFNGKSFTIYTTAQGLANDMVRCIYIDDKNNKWFGTAAGISILNDSYFTNYTTKQGLPSNIIWNINRDKFGNMWFATAGGGLSRFDGVSFLNYSKSNGLPDEVITQVVFDNDNNLLTGTNYGIAMLTENIDMNSGKSIPAQNNLTNKDLEKFIPRFEVFNTSTGYPIKDVNIGQNAMFMDSQSNIWIGTGANKTGLAMFNYKQLSLTRKTPEVFIQQLKIENEHICWNNLLSAKDKKLKKSTSNKALINEEVNAFGHALSASDRSIMQNKYSDVEFTGIANTFPVPENLVLPYKFNNLTFEFGAIEPSRLNTIKYQFMLEGYNKDWSPPGDAISATYGNIFEGTYTFKVRTLNSSGQFGPPTVFRFRVKPPLWRTWWMYTIYVLLFSFAVNIIIRLNSRRLKENEIRLKKEINEATEEILRQKEEVDAQRDLAHQRLIISEEQRKVILNSVEELKATQEKLMEAKHEAERANRAKSEFLSNMSHEIRTPLNAVLGFSELLKGNTKAIKYEKYVDGILTGGKNLLALINDILDLSKIEAEQMDIRPVPVNLKNMLGEFEQIFFKIAQEKNLDFKIEFSSHIQPVSVMIDETRIRQILFNLVGNALKFTETGSVTLALQITESGIESSKVNVVFQVSDTGIGIPESQQSLIFEAFKQQDGQSTRKYGGTGLGLTITKRLVDLMNGVIGLTSEPGKGSTFTVKLNNLDIAALEESSSDEQETHNCEFKGQTVLLVEDIESNREVVKGLLETVNLNVISVENGLEAINKLNHVKPDLILMDIMMPVMDGITTSKNIRGEKKYASIPVVMLTASAMRFGKNDLSDYCDDYLLKPVNKKSLIKTLAKYLPHELKEQTIEQNFSPAQHTLFHLPESIQSRLVANFAERWKKIAEMMSIDDIKDFSLVLKDFAETNNLSKIVVYAEQLKSSADEFDIELMNREFLKFREFLK